MMQEQNVLATVDIPVQTLCNVVTVWFMSSSLDVTFKQILTKIYLRKDSSKLLFQ